MSTAEHTGHGPYDSREYGEPGADLYDAGSLWLPAISDASLHFTVEKSNDKVLAAVYTVGDSAMQLQAYAAPRSRGLWDEIRLDMRTSIAEQGGVSKEVDGAFGKELIATPPAGQAPASAQVQHRFIGIDGERWFLKVSISGSAAVDEHKAQVFLDILRNLVVHRGQEPRPPKEMLDLTLPPKPKGRHSA